MIKVLCLSEMYPNPLNTHWGSFVHQQNQALMAKGVEIKVVSPVPWIPFPLSLNKAWKKFNQIPKQETLDGIEVYHPRRIAFPQKIQFHRNGFFYYQSILPLIKKIDESFHFNLIHAHVAFPDGVAGAFLKRDLDRPLVITVHGKDTANDRWSTVSLHPLCKKVIFEAFRSSSSIVGGSQYVKRTILEYYPSLPPDLIQVIHGGIDPLQMDPSSLKKSRYSKTRSLVSVGAFIPLKGHRFTIEAMKKVVEAFPDCVLSIIGEGEEKKDLIHLVETLGLKEAIHFMKPLPHDQLLRFMAQSDLFVLPSWAEGLGLVYLEAMALGIPVIGCRGQGIEDVVKHGETGFLVKPKDSEELSFLILMLLQDDRRRAEIARAGQQVVLNRFKCEDNAERQVALYRNLISGTNLDV